MDRLISNQAAGVQSWVKNFIGQQKCLETYFRGENITFLFDGNIRGCVEILQTGELKFSRVATLSPAYARFSQFVGPTYLETIKRTPSLFEVAADVGGLTNCDITSVSARFKAYPIYSNTELLNGIAPHDWTFSMEVVGCAAVG